MTFYKLEIGRGRKFIEGSSDNDWEPIVCSKDPGHQRTGRRVTDLFLDVLSWNVVDFSRTMLSDVVITDHALEVLRGASLTGFAIKPTRVSSFPVGIKGSEIPQLWEFVPTGTAGAAHRDSGIVELHKCEGCGLVRYSSFKNGIIVNEETYDGSDFFTVIEYPKYILASPRAKLVIERNRLSNVGFVQSSNLQWPKGVTEPV
jgi:hypothetical protein